MRSPSVGETPSNVSMDHECVAGTPSDAVLDALADPATFPWTMNALRAVAVPTASCNAVGQQRLHGP